MKKYTILFITLLSVCAPIPQANAITAKNKAYIEIVLGVLGLCGSAAVGGCGANWRSRLDMTNQEIDAFLGLRSATLAGDADYIDQLPDDDLNILRHALIGIGIYNLDPNEINRNSDRILRRHLELGQIINNLTPADGAWITPGNLKGAGSVGAIISLGVIGKGIYDLYTLPKETPELEEENAEEEPDFAETE